MYFLLTSLKFYYGNWLYFQYEWKLIFTTEIAHSDLPWSKGWSEFQNGLSLIRIRNVAQGLCKYKNKKKIAIIFLEEIQHSRKLQ